MIIKYTYYTLKMIDGKWHIMERRNYIPCMEYEDTGILCDSQEEAIQRMSELDSEKQCEYGVKFE